VTREGPRSEIRARPGTVELELPEIPTSGYLWQLVDPPAGVRELAREFTQRGEARAAGGGGTRVFRVEVTSHGRHDLEFRLQRPWEEDAIERRVVTLVVEPDAPDDQMEG
jgi:predicted secreted protein